MVQAMQVDVAGFERELDSQKKRSREALKSIDLTAGRLLGELAGQLGASNFIGYEHGSLRAEASVLALLKDGKTVDSASAGANWPCDILFALLIQICCIRRPQCSGSPAYSCSLNLGESAPGH